jgi:hypothetical protein
LDAIPNQVFQAAFVALTGGKSSQNIKVARQIIAGEPANKGVVAVVISLESLPYRRLK